MAKMGQPPKPIDWKLLDGILQYGAKLLDCAELCGVSEDTIQKRIRKEYDLTFTEYRERKMAKMRHRLLHKQFEKAMEGNIAMLIWLGKQHLGQSEKQEIHESNKKFSLAYADPEE